MTHAITRMFSETDHPRGQKGTTTGGQFTSGGGEPTKKKPAKTTPKKTPAKTAKKTAPAKPVVRPDAGILSYDPPTGRGTGYDQRDGDPRVRQLQAELNRLGIRDRRGRPLDVDGRLGPLTTEAVKAAQRRLGLPANGHVDPAMLSRLKDSPSPSARKAKKKCVCRSLCFCDLSRAMSSADVNDLSDEAFAYIEPGGSRDSSGRTVPRSLRHFPVHDAAHVRNALSRAPQSPFGDKAMPKIRAAAKKMGIAMSDDGIRSSLLYNRIFPLDDINIQRSGDGRTVEAYAAMFDSPYEVRDEHGHYYESIHRAAFDRTLRGNSGAKALCVYNHGMTLHGTPDGMASIPLGSPLEIRPDGRGLLTVTRYNKGPFADQVLESIRNGDIKAQSFRGRIIRSDPSGPIPRQRLGMALPTITRFELGLSDYGPTPIPVNAGAEILAVRSMADLVAELESLDADERYELLRHLAPSTPDEDPDDDEEYEEDLDSEEDEDDTATPDDSGPGAEDPPVKALRSAADIARRIRVEQILRGM